MQPALGGREEPLQIAHPVAAVAAGIDPVIAETAGIAPRPDRVGVDAEESSGLRHGEGRVDRAGGQGVGNARS